MNLSRFYAVSAAVIGAMLAVSLWGIAQVGPSVEVTIHWDASGQPNGYAPAWIAFLLTPAITAFVVALLAIVPRIEPRRENLLRSSSAYRTTGIALVLFMGLVHLGVVLAAVTGSFPMTALIGVGMGMLFIVMGNVMTTVRPNFMFGVRTPWTLTSDLAWDRTHRFMGRAFVLLGIALLVLTLTGRMELIIGFMLVALIVIVVGGFWYSYQVWKTDPDKRPTAGAA